jgi:UDP-N-acetylmuramoylalanine--D-glutamate ligase
MRSSSRRVVAVVERIASRWPASLEPSALAGAAVLVAGLGRSGRSAALHLADLGADVLACDDGQPERAELERAGVRVHTGGTPVELLDGRQLVVVAPGLAEHHPMIRAALDGGMEVWSEVELAARLTTIPLVGVTGTNGKTTTAELAAAMVAASGRRAVAAGNVGLPLIDAVLARRPPEALVVELSSFQLRFTSSLRLRAGAWLNLAPDHLDWHGSLEAYAAAKARVWANQGPQDWSLYAADDPVVTSHAAHATGMPVPFGVGRVPAGGLGVEAGIALSRVEGREGPLWRAAALRLPGRHNLANALAASGMAMALGAHPAAMVRAVSAFRAGPHRLAEVATVRGVRFVNDSKATNPHAAGRALAAFPRVVWIAGGRNKGLAFDELATEARPRLVGAVLIGEAAADIAAALGRAGYDGPLVRAASIGEAVTVGFNLAEEGDTVLLAPACASFDMFSSYAERGNAFTASVTRLAERHQGGAAAPPEGGAGGAGS